MRNDRTQYQAEVIFILSAPRTGSTFFYQLMINSFKLPYMSNFTNNCFEKYPKIGFFLQYFITPNIDGENNYGKTKGLFQPSEGSAVLSNWFGGGHPSQDKSTKILEGKEGELVNCLSFVNRLYRKPLIIKNAWNCFRIRYLAEAVPNAKFIWLRRSIDEAAISDLEARYLTKQNPHEWNSATPSNYLALKELEPYQQVVHNQYEFSKAISRDLKKYGKKRYLEVWYEDIVKTPEEELMKVSKFLGRGFSKNLKNMIKPSNKERKVLKKEQEKIRNYIAKNKCFSKEMYVKN